MIKTLINKIKLTSSYIKRNLIIPRIDNFKYRKILSKNQPLKDSRGGERCFIMGSGPSLKNIDLALLKDEHVFGVNEVNLHPQYKLLNNLYHVLVDDRYFQDEFTILTEELRRKSQQASPNTMFFLPIVGEEYINTHSLFNNSPKYYLLTRGIISTNFDFNIEIHKVIPKTKNVILACLFIATYMGFDEIYLLGCEHNFLSKNFGAGKEKTVSEFHGTKLTSYDNAQDAKQEQKLLEVNSSYEQNLAHILQLFKNYRLFYGKIKKVKPSVKIFNATPDSFLDVFPYTDFSSIRLLPNKD